MTTLEHLPTCAGGDVQRQEAQRPDGTTLTVTRCSSCAAQAVELVPAPPGYVQPRPRRRRPGEQLVVSLPRAGRRR